MTEYCASNQSPWTKTKLRTFPSSSTSEKSRKNTATTRGHLPHWPRTVTYQSSWNLTELHTFPNSSTSEKSQARIQCCSMSAETVQTIWDGQAQGFTIHIYIQTSQRSNSLVCKFETSTRLRADDRNCTWLVKTVTRIIKRPSYSRKQTANKEVQSQPCPGLWEALALFPSFVMKFAEHAQAPT